ncbi:MAG: hypothetical protein WEB30_18370 [Cyclobacteriaceae bacterium]
MPVDIYINGKKSRIKPTTEFQILELNTRTADITVDPNYYVYSFDLYGK